MRNWMHSHNLKQTTEDRLGMVVAELHAERRRLEAERALSPDEQAERQRVDAALPLLEAALEALRH